MSVTLGLNHLNLEYKANPSCAYLYTQAVYFSKEDYMLQFVCGEKKRIGQSSH